jgi:hypothetical protein
MRSSVVISLAASALCAFASCDKRPAPKFRVGDKVRIKWTDQEGKVSVWMRLFREDRYFVRFPGSDDVRLPVGVPDLNLDAAWASHFGTDMFRPKNTMTSSHDEGPFDDTELERAR